MKTFTSLLSLGLILASGPLVSVISAATLFVYPFPKAPTSATSSTESLAKQYLGSSELQAIHRTEDTIYPARKTRPHVSSTMS